MVGRWARLRPLRRRDFLHVQQTGERISSRYFLTLVWKRDDELDPRLGVTVTRKVGGSVRRSRIKRLVREWFRCNATGIGSYDVVVIAKRGLPGALKQQEVDGDLNGALSRAGYALTQRSWE